MDVSESTLRSILEGSKQYIVPLYQRPYAWRQPNWQKLWDDITELVESQSKHPTASHFTGTLVLEAGLVTTEITRFLVVDGQQRLTTLSVLLSSLADAYKAAGDADSQRRLQEQVLINPYRTKPDDRYRLRPANFDEPTYRDVLDGKNPKSDESLIDNASRFFAKRFSELEKSGISLEEFEAAALTGLKFVAITAKNDDNVYRIFESINNTGIDLTQADLIRNLVFSRLGDKAEEIHERLWRPLQKDLDGQDIENLFWIDAQWRNPEIRKLDTYEFQKSYLMALDEAQLTQYLENALEIANALRKVRSKVEDEDAAINFHLSRIFELALPSALVLTTRIVYLHGTGKISNEDCAGALKVLEGYLVRRSIASVPISSLQKISAACAHDLFGDATSEVQRMLSTGRKKFITDGEIKKIVLEAPVYEKGRRPRLASILSWLLSDAQGKDGIDFSSMSIEHILPQKLGDEAKTEFSLALSPGQDLSEEHESLVHTFGNLTLTNYNSELSNSAFSIKRNSWLSKTAVVANQEIAKLESWGPTQIRQRSVEMAEVACAIWPGPDESLLESEPETIGQRIDDVVSAIPRGRWTSYGDIAKVLGTAGQVVGQRVSKEYTSGAWRVLRASGEIAPGFKWSDTSPNAGRDLREVLVEEGVTFDDKGLATEELRLRPEDILELTSYN